VVQLSTGQRRQVLWRASRGWHTRQVTDCQRRDCIAIFSPTAAYTLEGRSHKSDRRAASDGNLFQLAIPEKPNPFPIGREKRIETSLQIFG
jgi:hypothetical protein